MTISNENTNHNSQEWIGAGRYHPDWTLTEWKRELERSRDLWPIVDRLEEQSVTQNGFNYALQRARITDQHRFTEVNEGDEFVLLQPQWNGDDVFWLYDLVVEAVPDKSHIKIKVRRIREVFDTTEGMILGSAIVSLGTGEIITYEGKSRYVLGDKHIEEEAMMYSSLPEEHYRQIYLTVQNWAYRKTH